MTYHSEMIPFFLSLFLRVALVYYSWLHRDVPAARTFGWLMLAGAWMTGFYILHLADPTLEGKLLWKSISLIGAVTTPALWLIFSLEITDHQRWLTRRVRAAILSWPLIVILIFLTNDLHHLFWEHYELSDYRLEWEVEFGPLFQLYQLPVFILFFFIFGIFARYFFTCPRFYKPQAVLLGLAAIFPVGGRIIQLTTGFVFVDRVDQVPLFQGISAIFYAVAVFRYNALDVLSFAQRLVIDNIRAAIIVVDHRQRILGMNPYASRRWPHIEPVGAPLTEVIPEYSDRSLADGDEWELQHFFEGENHWYLTKASAITDRHNDKLGFALILLDISAQKKVSETLQEAMEARSRFLANISHELRTPLHGITGLIQLALSTKLTDQQDDYLKKADSSALLLLSLINDFLDFSRIQAGKLVIEEVSFNVNAVVNHVKAVIDVNAKNSGIELRISQTPFSNDVIGDPLRLEQVLLNLAGNAVKFTQEGYVEIELVVRSESESDVQIEFRINDTGIGIAPDRIEHLFKSFEQVDSSITRRFGGTGLGLAISHELVANMGGSIEVASQEGVGSTFSFCLPFVWGEETSTDEPVVSNRPDLNGLRILVVDDAEINQIIACELLENAGAEVVVASSGSEALTKMSEIPMDLVFMDVQMPGMDGYEVTRQIRENSQWQSLPVIAMTASVQLQDKELAFSAGMNDFVPKPFRDVELYASISKNIQLKQTTSQSSSPADPLTSLPSSLPGIAFDDGLVRLQGNTPLYLKLLGTFNSGLAAQFDALKIAAKQEPIEIKPLANKIRGAADNLSATRIAAVAALLEGHVAKGDGGNKSDLENQLSELGEALKEFAQSVALLSSEEIIALSENED